MVKFFTKSPSETKRLGEILAKEVLKTKSLRAFVLGLEGDLGGGKTTFLKGFAKGLGIKEKILSPTFILFKKFKIQNSNFKFFYHIDCYRIERPKEILDLGFKGIVSNPKNIVAVEWAEKVKKILPKKSLILDFEFLNSNWRQISLGIKK